MSVIRQRDRWAAATAEQVGSWLSGLGANCAASRVEKDGTRVVSWHFSGESPHAGRGRRGRQLVFRAQGGDLDRWEVVYSEQGVRENGRDTITYASRSAQSDLAGLRHTAERLLRTGLPSRGRAVVADEGPRAAGVGLGDSVLGVLGALGLLVLGLVMVSARPATVAVLPSLASLAVPLLSISTGWLLIHLVVGLAGGSQRRRGARPRRGPVYPGRGSSP